MYLVTLIHQSVHQPIPVIGRFNHHALQTCFKFAKHLEDILDPIIVALTVESFVFGVDDTDVIRAIYGLPNQPKFLGIQRGIKIFYPKNFWPGRVKSVG